MSADSLPQWCRRPYAVLPVSVVAGIIVVVLMSALSHALRQRSVVPGYWTWFVHAVVLQTLPFITASCVASLLAARSRWLLGLLSGLLTWLVYCPAWGLYWRMVLPSEAEWKQALEDAATRMSALADVFSGDGLAWEPTWGEVAELALIYLPFALGGTVLGVLIGWSIVDPTRAVGALRWVYRQVSFPRNEDPAQIAQATDGSDAATPSEGEDREAE